ncbi:cytochrome oxidase small assembly protein [Polynucleobacter sp. TUM22923]|uniref:cytochrome oxidase small assembly protein n=1 Tax=Polynucleobacter sp. TUM22923 TaxID=3022126 RepID=UPI0033656C79
MVLKVWSGPFHRQRHTILLKHLLTLKNCMQQESKHSLKEIRSASNRRLGFILLSVAVIFFIGILVKRSVLG